MVFRLNNNCGGISGGRVSLKLNVTTNSMARVVAGLARRNLMSRRPCSKVTLAPRKVGRTTRLIEGRHL